MPGPMIYAAVSESGGEVYERPVWKRYGMAVLLAGVTVVLRWALNPWLEHEVPWLFLLPSALASAWYGRYGPGIVTTGIGAVATWFLWPQPTQRETWIGLVAYSFTAVLICSAVGSSHRARRDLELERRFLNTVLSSITDRIAVLGPDWRYLYVNAAAADLSRKPAEELLGHVIWEVFPQLKGTVLERELLSSRQENRPVHFEMAFPQAGLWLEIRAHPMSDSTVLYISDISVCKRAEIELTAAREELAKHAARLEETVHERTAKLEETVHELEQFSYTISHDLRAPLRALEGYASFTLQDYGHLLEEPGREYLNRIQSAAQRMDRLINDVLVYTRVSRGSLKLSPIDLDSLLNDIVAQYNPELKGRILIRHPLGVVQGNEAMVTQVLSNLLGNAAKFVPANSPPQIEVFSDKRDDRLRVSVSDHGIGIPAAAQGKVFKIFERAHHGYPGTGIGLAIVKRAVERMSGQVGFESEVGAGSTFWFELPSGDNDAARAGNTSPSTAHSAVA